MKIKKIFVALLFLICASSPVLAVDSAKSATKFPDWGNVYLGEDKFETTNRKVFMFNQKLNKYLIKPVHIVWASIMPKYGMDRIQSAYTNIEYPKRLVSTIMQRDFKATGTETIRFITNSTIGLGGMFDPAQRFFKIEPAAEDVGQGLARCKIKQGPYLVLPVMNSTTPRDALGKLIECPLDPSMYIGSPVTALVKLGLLVNRSAYMQPLAKMIESNYADPYDIARKMYGVERFIKQNNFDRSIVLNSAFKKIEEDINKKDNNEITVQDDSSKLAIEDNVLLENLNLTQKPLKADIYLYKFNPQDPVTDAMRTALFDLPGMKNKFWSELSIWNRSFDKKIKSDKVNIDPERQDYLYRYILQKDKTSPLAIIYPSIGEGVNSHHSIVFAKMFFNEGFSVLILGSHFNWEFVKSAPKGYVPGVPQNDIEHLKTVTQKAIAALEDKHGCSFNKKILLGTSFGAFETLYLADSESRENTLNISKFIAINPPIELMYAIKCLDEKIDNWDKNPENLKERVAISAAKIVQLYNLKNNKDDFNIEMLPFTQEESKLITCFVLRQKLSDLIFALNEVKRNKKSDIYEKINNMNYNDYAVEYMAKTPNVEIGSLGDKTSLFSIENYLKNNNNYKIYHTLDDFFVNHDELRRLKEISGQNLVLINCGSHLGYLYRSEFKGMLKRDILQ